MRRNNFPTTEQTEIGDLGHTGSNQVRVQSCCSLASTNERGSRSSYLRKVHNRGCHQTDWLRLQRLQSVTKRDLQAQSPPAALRASQQGWDAPAAPTRCSSRAASSQPSTCCGRDPSRWPPQARAPEQLCLLGSGACMAEHGVLEHHGRTRLTRSVPAGRRTGDSLGRAA